MYIPIVKDIWHLWDRSYRPRFGSDSKDFAADKKKQLQGNAANEQFDNQKQGDIIRRKIYGDREYVRWMDEVWGLDILG